MSLYGLNLYFVNFNIVKATRSQFFACIFEIIEPPKRYKKNVRENRRAIQNGQSRDKR